MSFMLPNGRRVPLVDPRSTVKYLQPIRNSPEQLLREMVEAIDRLRYGEA